MHSLLCCPWQPLSGAFWYIPSCDKCCFRYFSCRIFFAGYDSYPQTASDLDSVPGRQVGAAFNSERSRQELNTIASKPSRDHVFRVNNFEALKTIQNQLQEKIFAIEGELRLRISGTAPEAAPHPQTCIPLWKLEPPTPWYPDPQHQLSPLLPVPSNSGCTWSATLE